MATIRFIREDLEVQCNPCENLRELVMRENLKLYGLKGLNPSAPQEGATGST